VTRERCLSLISSEAMDGSIQPLKRSVS